MFLGTYDHSMDEKGRLVLPRKYRDQLHDGCVITKGQENCLYVYPLESWQREYDRISRLPTTDRRARKFRRSFFAGADNISLDKQGRIQIPEKLRTYASLEKAVTVVGSAHYIEVWSTEVWETEETEADEYYSGIEEALSLSGDTI